MPLGAIPVFPKGKEFYLNALNTPSTNFHPLGRVRGGASPPADTVIATKAEPSDDAIGFLCLTPFCPNLVNVHRKTTLMV